MENEIAPRGAAVNSLYLLFVHDINMNVFDITHFYWIYTELV